MCGDLFFAFTMVKPHRTITKALMYNYIFSTGLQGNYKLVSFNIHSITNQSNILCLLRLPEFVNVHLHISQAKLFESFDS